MRVWGKILGGTAGMLMGGPVGAMFGAALGHSFDNGGMTNLRMPTFGSWSSGFLSPARMAALLGRKDQVFAICVVVLAAKLAKCDGPVRRLEIDAFKSQFRIPAEAVHDIARLFDQARDSPEGFRGYAVQLGETFADNRGMLEDVLASLFTVARADGPVNQREHRFLSEVHAAFGLDQRAWDRARGATPRQRSGADEADPYLVLGVPRSATGAELHAAWRRLMRENHPDSLAARGVPQEFIARASEKVARINAAWDRIKRERNL
jgi:DnaJ like chaperone protein